MVIWYWRWGPCSPSNLLPAAVLALVVMTLLLSSFHSIGAAWITDRFADPEVPVLRSKVLYKAFSKHRYQPYHPLYHHLRRWVECHFRYRHTLRTTQ